MGSALIPLMGQPAQIPSGMQINNSLAVLAGQQQMNAQQAIKTQSDQLALNQQKQFIDDSNTFRASLVANKGDVDKSLQDVLPKVSPLSYQQFYNQNLAHKKDLAVIAKDTLETHKDNLNRLGDLHDKTMAIPDDQYNEQWPQVAASGNNIDPNLNLDPNKPIPKAQLESMGVVGHTASWYVEQELKNRQAQESAAKATASQATAAKETEATKQAQVQNAAITLSSAGNDIDYANRQNELSQRGVPDSVLKLFPQSYSPEGMQQVKSMAIGPVEQAKLAQQIPEEKQHVADYLAANNLPLTPANRLRAEADYARMHPAATVAVQNASAGPALTDAALDNAAENYWNKGVLPPGGRSALAIAQNRRIMDRAAQLHPGESIGEGSAAYAANKGSLATVQKNLDTVSAFENTAIKNLDQVAKAGAAIPDLGARFANIPVRMISSQMLGTPEMARFRTALLTAQAESAKVLTSANASGVLSNDARHEAQQILDGDLSFPAMMASINQLKTDFGNRHQSYQDQVNDIKKRIGGGKKTSAEETAAPAEHPFFSQFGGTVKKP
jgi:hypothetical protein